MANFYCFFHRQRGMSAPLWFGRNTNSADTNDKTNKMKKKLLMLSCCLATWCSVQAGMKSSTSCSEVSSMSQRAVLSDIMRPNSSFAASSSNNDYCIESVSFNKDNSAIIVNYNAKYGSNATVVLTLFFQGKFVYKREVSAFLSSVSFPVERTWEEGKYQVMMWVSGYSAPVSQREVAITAYGKISGISNVSTQQLNVRYGMCHAYSPSSWIKVFKGRSTDPRNQILEKKIENPNTSSSIQVYSNKFEPGTEYTFLLRSRERDLDTFTYVIPIPASGHIYKITYVADQKELVVNYTLKNAPNALVSIYETTSGYDKLVKTVEVDKSIVDNNIVVNDLVLDSWRKYDVVISAYNNKWSIRSSVTPFALNPTGGNNDITNLSCSGSTLKVDYTLKQRGVTVGFKLVNVRTGKTYDCGSYYNPDNYGTRYISLPSESGRGSFTYAVILTVNDNTVIGRNIVITR